MPRRAPVPVAALTWLLVIPFALLAGCRTLPPIQPTPAGDWPGLRARLQALKSYELQGSIGVAAGQDGFSASFHWAQAGTASEVALRGPLGAGGLQLRADGDALELTDSSGRRLDAIAARAELIGRLGFEPPIASLRYWLLGVPDPHAAAPVETLDPQSGRLAHLEQSDWQVDYPAYGPAQRGGSADVPQLPRRITLLRPGVRVRLAVHSWRLGP